MKHFTDRVAVVTGAGSGIGAATAIELARRGCHVALTDVTEDRLDATAQTIEAMGRRVTRHGFDVSDREAWPGFVEAVLAAHGRVHLLMNNAGVSLVGKFLECSLEDIDWQLQINQYGVLYGCHYLVPHLIEAGRADGEAHLVNVSSIFGIISVPANSAYCMSKHAVKALTESLDIELWDEPITVTSVHPGSVATRITEDGRHRADPTGPFAAHKARRAIANGITPKEAATTIVGGIERGKRRILVGSDARWFAAMQQAMPVRYRNLVRRWVKRLEPDR